MRIADEREKDRPHNVSGEHKAEDIDHKGKLPSDAALDVEHGASRNGEHEKLSVVLAMINGQHGKGGYCSQREPSLVRRHAGPERGDCPHEQKESKDQIAGRIVDARVVGEDAGDGLEADDHTKPVRTC